MLKGLQKENRKSQGIRDRAGEASGASEQPSVPEQSGPNQALLPRQHVPTIRSWSWNTHHRTQQGGGNKALEGC